MLHTGRLWDCPRLLGKEQLLGVEVGTGQSSVPAESLQAQGSDHVGQFDTSTWPGPGAHCLFKRQSPCCCESIL